MLSLKFSASQKCLCFYLIIEIIYTENIACVEAGYVLSFSWKLAGSATFLLTL